MNSIALFGTRIVRKVSFFPLFSRNFCDSNLDSDNISSGYIHIEEPLSRTWRFADSGSSSSEKRGFCEPESSHQESFSVRRSFFETARLDATRVLDILQQDGPGFDTKSALDELKIRVSGVVVREVFLGMFRSMSHDNKPRCARLAYKFFAWSGQQEDFKHSPDSYHLMMKILAECEEYKTMWRLVDEMVENGFPTTARTFNIVISTCGEAGLAKEVVERFIKSKNFNYRPFRHSYNAILHSLLIVKEYKLIEWVHQKMEADGFSPDVLTYNVIMCAKYRLGKLDQFYRLLDEMGRTGFSPDLHTYNMLLHVLGKGDKPLAALSLLNHMKEVGIEPCVFHYTTLIDGLSRAGNLEACRYFFDEIGKIGCIPDVVCYTVMITGYVANREFEKAQNMFDEMIVKGLCPNVFTYNSMIRGYCIAKRFQEACLLLKEMESRGCNPNFTVYSTLVSNLRNEGMDLEASKVVRDMVEKGRYMHLVSKIKAHWRC